MSRETIQAKAERYLTEGRLTLLSAQGDHVTAVCKGNGEVYRLGHHPARGWYCSCPARTFGCAHLTALRKVWSRHQP